MRTKQQSSQREMSWAAMLITLVVIILCSGGQKAAAQQWTTNGNNISNTNTGNVGIGTSTPSTRLEVVGPGDWVAKFRRTSNSNGGILIESPTGFNPNVALGVNGSNKWYLLSNTSSSDALQFWDGTAGSQPRFTLTQTGKIGIGTTAPNYNLEVSSGPNPFLPAVNIMTSTDPTSERATIGFGQNATGTQGWSFGQDHNANGTRDMYLFDVANNRAVMYWGVSSNVGIGTTTPSAKLEVVGNVNVTGTGNITAAGTIEGGNIKAKYQDVAEWVESSQELPAGTVVVVDHTKSNQVIASSQAYDTRVAGVISSQPGIALGEAGHNKVLVATTGRVRIKVDASHGPIQVGDLLVTSDIPGVAMKSQALNIAGVQLHRPGTLIGKALEPLTKGSGEILVLLSLQ